MPSPHHTDTRTTPLAPPTAARRPPRPRSATPPGHLHRPPRRLRRTVRRTQRRHDALVADACAYAWLQLARRPDVTLDRRGFAWLNVVAIREALATRIRPATDAPRRPPSSPNPDNDDELPEPASPRRRSRSPASSTHETQRERVERFASSSRASAATCSCTPPATPTPRSPPSPTAPTPPSTAASPRAAVASSSAQDAGGETLRRGPTTTMILQPITYRGHARAACTRDRVFLSAALNELEPDHPLRIFVLAMCLYAGEVLNGLQDGPYRDQDARAGYARGEADTTGVARVPAPAPSRPPPPRPPRRSASRCRSSSSSSAAHTPRAADAGDPRGAAAAVSDNVELRKPTGVAQRPCGGKHL